MNVAIVIPAYNEEHYIAATVRAALAQDYPNTRVIVVDNASTDQTAAIAASLGATVVREDRKGLLYARECGRRAAGAADIIANLDADCLPPTDWVSRALPFFEKQQVVAVSGPCDYYDARPAVRYFLLGVFLYISRPLNTLMQLPFLKLGGYITGGNNFIRRSVIERMGGYNTDILFWGEDTDTAKRISKYGKVVFSHRVTLRTSGRRFANENIWKTFYRYTVEFFNRGN